MYLYISIQNLNLMKYPLIAILLCLAFTSNAQTPLWAFKSGAGGNDAAIDCQVAPNGNIYVIGTFNGTIDLNPGAAIYNVTSVGGQDVFVACYSTTGSFIWGFSIGGPNTENVGRIAVDATSNIIISGSFQGGMDADPSPAVAMLPFARVPPPIALT